MTAQKKPMTEALQAAFADLPPRSQKRRKLSDYVYNILSERIVMSKLKPGQRLTEADVADALGVSRTPVREAFARLERQHLLQKNSSGTYSVTEWDRQKLWEVASLRSTLERLAIRLVCENITPAALDYLRGIITQMEAALKRRDYDRLISLDIQFHSYIWDHAGHELLQEALKDMKVQVQHFMYLTRPGFEDEYPQTHQEIIDVLELGDARKAMEVIHEHTMVNAERAIEAMEQRRKAQRQEAT